MYYLRIMKSLYIDASNSGISGDMFLAALFELIPNASEILKELQEVKDFLAGVSKLEIELEKIKRSGILVNRLKISIKEEKTNRTPKVLKDSLNAFLKEKKFSSLAKIYANDVLDKLIKAEADVHGKLIDQIHLHELSSIDTLVDILGVTKLLDTLGAFETNFKIFCSKLPLGSGTIKSAHGTLPVPAPATLKILENSKVKGMLAISKFLKWIIVLMVIIIALKQIGLKVELFENAFLLVIGALAIGIALALGIALGVGLRKDSEKLIRELLKNF